jgi:hypothetical protein
MTDNSFWIGIGAAIPLSIAGNFATALFQKLWADRPNRKNRSLSRQLERRLKKGQEWSEIYSGPTLAGVAALLRMAEWFAYLIVMSSLLVLVLTDPSPGYFKPAMSTVLYAFIAGLTGLIYRDIRRTLRQMWDMEHLAPLRDELARLAGESPESIVDRSRQASNPGLS